MKEMIGAFSAVYQGYVKTKAPPPPSRIRVFLGVISAESLHVVYTLEMDQVTSRISL